MADRKKVEMVKIEGSIKDPERKRLLDMKRSRKIIFEFDGQQVDYETIEKKASKLSGDVYVQSYRLRRSRVHQALIHRLP